MEIRKQVRLGVIGIGNMGSEHCRLILDCLNRTENAMTQEHAFKAAELCLLAQENAVRIFNSEL